MLTSMKLQQRKMPLNTSYDRPEHLRNRLPFVSAAAKQHIRARYGRLEFLEPGRLRPAMIPCQLGLGAHLRSILREAIPTHTTRKSLYGKIRIVRQHPHAKMFARRWNPMMDDIPVCADHIQLPVVFDCGRAPWLKSSCSRW